MCPCPHSSVAFGENFFASSRIATELLFYPPIEAMVIQALASTRPQEREFVVDSGASMQIMSKNIKSRREGHSKKVQNPYKRVYCKSRIRIHEEAQVFVQDLNLLIAVHCLDETSAISLGNLCEHHGYSCEWVSGRKPRKTKDGKTIICKSDNVVPLVVPGLSGNPESSSSVASLSQNSLRKRGGKSKQATGATCLKFIFKLTIKAK